MAIASCSSSGQPSLRYVLLKGRCACCQQEPVAPVCRIQDSNQVIAALGASWLAMPHCVLKFPCHILSMHTVCFDTRALQS